MRLHASHLSAARAAVLLAALAGPGAAQDGSFLAPSPTASLVDGLIQVAWQEVPARLAGVDMCTVVHGRGVEERAWSADTPQAAAVFLWVGFADGSAQMGSGTVVAGSDHGHGNRVLSASHVFEHPKGASLDRVLAFGQDGVLLASLQPTRRGQVRPIHEGQTVQEVRQDWAVLEPTALVGIDAQGWNAMGAPLADKVPVDAMIVGQPHGTALLAPGASGGAVFDDRGAVLGVLVQTLPSSEEPRVAPAAPFARALADRPTGDAGFDAFAAFVAKKGEVDGVVERAGDAGLAIPVLGEARVALAGAVPQVLEAAEVRGTMTVFPSGECRTGAVTAFPRTEPDRARGSVDNATIVPLSSDAAWAQLQGTGWYPKDLPDRVTWQALRGMERDAVAVPSSPVLSLLEKAKASDGRVGLEATRIEAGLKAGLRQQQIQHASDRADGGKTPATAPRTTSIPSTR